MRRFPLLLLLLVACDSPAPPDAGAVDSGPADAGGDAGEATPDAGPPVEPTGEMALVWAQRITSDLRLGGAAEARLALLPSDRFAMSLTLSGAPAQYAAGTPEAREVGVGLTQATQVISTWEGTGQLIDARLTATEDTSSLDGFAALGYGLAAHTDGSLFVSGRFEAGARFGVTDPLAISYTTIREMPEEMVTVTSAEGYLARFDSTPQIVWARRGRSDSGFADHRFTDVVALADGSTLVTGSFTRTVTLGEGEATEIDFTQTSTAEVEVFFAKYDPDGALVWARRLAGHSTPGRIAAFSDGSFASVFRYNQAVVVGQGETNERTLPAPPDGTIAWDAVARYDADGQLVWVTALGSEATTYPGLRSVLPRADGSITVAGTFRGMLAWIDESLEPLRINAIDGLVAQLDPDGNLEWQTRVTPVRDLQVQALAPTADGDGSWLVLTVGASGMAAVLPDASTFEIPRSTIDSRLVMLRFDGDGALQAAQHLASVETDGDDLRLTPDGDLLLVGRFGDGTVLEPGTTAQVPLPTASAFRNVFVARYTPRSP